MPPSTRIQIPYFGRLWTPNPIQIDAHQAVRNGIRYVGIAGGSRSGKSVWLINEILDLCFRHHGYVALLSRWTDDSTQAILKPLFYEIARNHYHADWLGKWVAREERQFFTNGSSVYIRSLKAADDVSRYNRYDGLSLGAFAISQLEEVPKDVWERIKTRLSQPGVPRHGLFELNPTIQDSYIYREFEEAQTSDHKLLHASMYDNRENLPETYIQEMELQYPPGHPLRRRLIEGGWGLTSRGEPIIGDLFNADLHVRPVDFDPDLPLILSYDPGVTRPALTWAQISKDGQLRVLDCILGDQEFADGFFARAFQQQQETFGTVREIVACADRSSQQRHGNSPKTEFDIFTEHLKPWEVTPITGVVASKQFLIQRLASRFSRLIKGSPAIVFHPRCEYLIEAMAGGWVWRPATETRPNQRSPKADGYYEHGADTLLYVEMSFGPGIRKPRKAQDSDSEPDRKPRRRVSMAGY